MVRRISKSREHCYKERECTKKQRRCRDNSHDGTCVSLAFPIVKVMCLHCHLEAFHGPHDLDPAFYELTKLIWENKHIDK
jgi:carbamoylphosphate synthase small subunit